MSLATQEFGLFSKEVTSSIETGGLKTTFLHTCLGQPHPADNSLCRLFIFFMEPGT